LRPPLKTPGEKVIFREEIARSEEGVAVSWGLPFSVSLCLDPSEAHRGDKLTEYQD
jgi:hypothetical protein